MRREPAYKRISRKRAYGKTFFTNKQRRWFFWALKQGIIKPGQNNRTHKMSQGWEVVPTKSGARVVNRVPHAKWSHDPKRRARLNKLVGWRTPREITAANAKSMKNAGVRAINDIIKDESKK